MCTWAGLGNNPSSFAWSSRNCPLFEPVHQLAIERVLGKVVSADDLKILKEEQDIVDQDQKPAQSDEHSMAGWETKEQQKETQRRVYLDRTEKAVHVLLSNAIKARQTGYRETSMHHLGKALHALEDATSPAHEKFQVWSYNESWWSMTQHVMKERHYPEEKKPGEYRERLEGVVEFAYQIYMETESMPERFFTAYPDGMVVIPGKYLHH